MEWDDLWFTASHMYTRLILEITIKYRWNGELGIIPQQLFLACLRNKYARLLMLLLHYCQGKSRQNANKTNKGKKKHPKTQMSKTPIAPNSH